MSEQTTGQPIIIVVDDESIVVSLVRDALEDEPYVIHTAQSAEEALNLLAQHRCDLLLTDIRMPGMDGIEMVKRAHQIHPELGVIFMTGYANLNSAKNAIKEGAFDYIMKPFELTEIRTAVKNAIGKLADSASKGADQELTKLSDLNLMLFTANDRSSLVTSSLKFIMMHRHATDGSALFCDNEQDACVVVTIRNDQVEEARYPHDAMMKAATAVNMDDLRHPFLLNSIDDHPLYKADPRPELKAYLAPAWARPGQRMVIVPVSRNDTLFGFFVLGLEDGATLKDADIKFLALTASQLAITLENMTLLEETQRAYTNLKELQDETIRLEKMATRGQMSAEIGHELNNFLGVVVGNLSLLDIHLKKGNYQDLGRYVTQMMDTMEKMKRFTSGLMDLSSISSEKALLSFDGLLSEVVDFLKPQKRFRGVQINVSRLPRGIQFEADQTQMQQLLYNLFNNAADATLDSGHREITVSVDVDEAGGVFHTIIADTGSGFSPELLAKAFQERFTTKKTGHGFGLVVCKRIIENHGGKLHVDSTPGQGTSISIEFPLAVPALAMA
jgi:signal transduction histidine kinase/CheY-like chemotaxis protein